MSVSEERAIIMLIHGVPTIWNQKYYEFARKNRIIGTFTGPLPKFCQEKINFGLPYRLQKVEAKLLVDKGLAEIYEFPSLGELHKPKLTEKYKLREKEVNKNENKLAFEERKAEIIKMASKIFEGKLRKENQKSDNSLFLENTDLNIDDIICKEIGKFSGKNSKFVEIFVEYPHLMDIPIKPVDWNYPESKEDKLLYTIFKDLWEKGYTLTSGIKFGGDYLAYQGNPNEYHASFIIKYLDDESKVNPNDLVAWIRVGTITKKSLVIASIGENQVVHYHSFHWPIEELK